MRTALPLLLSLAVVSPAPADGLKAGTAGGKSTAEALVEQLGDRDFRTREAAGKKLLDLGPPAVAALEAGLESPVPEVASRCADLLPTVKRKVESDAILAPTLVDLPDDERTVAKVFEAIEKQTRYKLSVVGDQAVLSGKVKLPGGKVPFWEAVVAVCEACKLEVATVVPDPAKTTGTVSLQARSTVTRTFVHHALLVQVTAASQEVRAAHTTEQHPLVVRVFPEPRVKWQRLNEALLVKAVAPDDKAIGPGRPTTLPQRVRLEEEVRIRGGRRPIREQPTDFSDAATRRVLTLAADPDGPTGVGTLSGLLRAGVWKEGGEVATVRLKDGDTEGIADGPHGSTLAVKVIGPVANRTDETLVEVTHRWNADKVRPDSEGGSVGDGEGVWFESRDGRMVPVKAAAPARKGVRPNQWGIVMLDAAGEPLVLTATGTRIDNVADGGRAFTTLTATYIVRKDKSASGKPATVAFHATRVVDVSLPFTVKDLPLAAGTAEHVPELEERLWKR